MPLIKSGVAVVVAACGVAVPFASTPAALADTCDPAVVVCDGPASGSTGNVQINDSPPPVSVDQGYPFDDDWYFNPGGGGTVLQPNHPGGGGGGGGGHR